MGIKFLLEILSNETGMLSIKHVDSTSKHVDFFQMTRRVHETIKAEPRLRSTLWRRYWRPPTVCLGKAQNLFGVPSRQFLGVFPVCCCC